MANGFIKIDRGISNWPEFDKLKQKNGLSIIEAYLWLVDNARYSNTPAYREWCGKTFKVEKNQIVASLSFLAKAWGLYLSNGNLDKKKVQRYLQKMHKNKRIYLYSTQYAQCITLTNNHFENTDYQKNKQHNVSTKKALLFKNSVYNDYSFFEQSFANDEFITVFDTNLHYYHSSLLDWSNAKQQKSYDWLAEARNWMRRDKINGKLITNSKTEKVLSNETQSKSSKYYPNQKRVDELANMLWHE